MENAAALPDTALVIAGALVVGSFVVLVLYSLAYQIHDRIIAKAGFLPVWLLGIVYLFAFLTSLAFAIRLFLDAQDAGGWAIYSGGLFAGDDAVFGYGPTQQVSWLALAVLSAILLIGAWRAGADATAAAAAKK